MGVFLPLVFSTGGNLSVSGDIFGCPSWGATDICWVQVRDAAEHPTTHRMPPPQAHRQQRIILHKMLIAQRLRNPALNWESSISEAFSATVYTQRMNTGRGEIGFHPSLSSMGTSKLEGIPVAALPL